MSLPGMTLHMDSTELEALARCFSTRFEAAIAQRSPFVIREKEKIARSRRYHLKEVAWDNSKKGGYASPLFFFQKKTRIHLPITTQTNYNSPHDTIRMGILGFVPMTGTASHLRTVNMLGASNTLPNTTCFPSNHSAAPHVIKN